MVQLRGIEELSLDGLLDQDIKNFVNELVKVGSSQLKYLQIEGFRGPSLRELNKEETTTDMRSSEIILEDDVIVSNTLFIEKVALPNLETLELDTILNIERIWQNQVAALSCGIQNLTRLIIRSLRNLRYLFSSSIVISFARLQYLEILWCPIMEKIVNVDHEYREEEEENRKNVMFPQLQVLKMICLEKLTSFCARDVHIEFPSLKELSIVNCLEFTLDFSKQHQIFPNLEELRVDVKHITTKRHFPEDLLCNLKCLDLFFTESTSILSLDDFFQRLHTMKVLKIEGGECNWLSNEKIENGMSAIIRQANKCRDLKHIIKQESFNMDNLVHLQVRWCDNLISLVPSLTSFQNLTTLKVWSSKGLVSILTSSTAKSLVRMEIGECRMITEIVADDGDAAKDEIVFKDLKELELSDLESLTSFCSGDRCFKFPSLERLAVDNCPNMKVFSRGELSTPKLHKLMLFRWDRQDWSWMIEEDGTHKAFEVYWTWKGNVNTTIQHLYQKRLEMEKEENDRSTKVTNAGGSENESSEEDLGHASMQHLEDE